MEGRGQIGHERESAEVKRVHHRVHRREDVAVAFRRRPVHDVVAVDGPGEALVRVRACALNHLDLWQRRGIERVSIPFPHISGADVAGEVVSAPGGEYGFGRRVMLQPGLSCGRCAACLDGRDNECPTYDVLGYRSDGGYAEYVKVPVQNLIAIPDAIGFVEAAAFPLTFLTAWHMLITRAKLRAGLLIYSGQRITCLPSQSVMTA